MCTYLHFCFFVGNPFSQSLTYLHIFKYAACTYIFIFFSYWHFLGVYVCLISRSKDILVCGYTYVLRWFVNYYDMFWCFLPPYGQRVMWCLSASPLFHSRLHATMFVFFVLIKTIRRQRDLNANCAHGIWSAPWHPSNCSRFFFSICKEGFWIFNQRLEIAPHAGLTDNFLVFAHMEVLNGHLSWKICFIVHFNFVFFSSCLGCRNRIKRGSSALAAGAIVICCYMFQNQIRLLQNIISAMYWFQELDNDKKFVDACYTMYINAYQCI